MNFTKRFEHYATQRLREIIIELCNDENGGPVRIRDYSQMLFNIHERGVRDAMARRSLYEGEDIQDLWRRIWKDYWTNLKQIQYEKGTIEIIIATGKTKVSALIAKYTGLAINQVGNSYVVTHLASGLRMWDFETYSEDSAKAYLEEAVRLMRVAGGSWQSDIQTIVKKYGDAGIKPHWLNLPKL